MLPRNCRRDPEHGFLTVDPLPTQAELDAYYNSIFYAGESAFNDSSREVRDRDREYLRWQFEDIEGWAIDFLSKDSISVLDVGCGFGHALEFFQDRGHLVQGVEPSPEAAEHCRSRGLNVVDSTVEPYLASHNSRYDLVIMFHVLEHVLDPRSVLAACRHVLEDGALLYISVPNDFSLLQDVAVNSLNLTQWWFQPPRHVNYFSHTSLVSLLKAEGYEILIETSDFPLEVFLLMGLNYVREPELGRIAHEQRVALERAVRGQGHTRKLQGLYQELAKHGIGREIRILARSPRRNGQ